MTSISFQFKWRIFICIKINCSTQIQRLIKHVSVLSLILILWSWFQLSLFHVSALVCLRSPWLYRFKKLGLLLHIFTCLLFFHYDVWVRTHVLILGLEDLSDLIFSIVILACLLWLMLRAHHVESLT